MARKTRSRKSVQRNKPARTPRKARARAAVDAIPGSPKSVSTGKGPGPRQLGEELVRRFNRGQWEITPKLWADSMVCIEGSGQSWHGRKNVDAKNAHWYTTSTPRGASAEGPYVGSTGFAVKFRMDIEDKATGKRTLMEEVGVYTVHNGKIIREEFMYGPSEPVAALPPAPPPPP